MSCFAILHLIRESPHLEAASVPTSIATVLVIAGISQQILFRMPSDGESGRIHTDVGHLLTGLRVPDIDDQVLAGRCQ